MIVSSVPSATLFKSVAPVTVAVPPVTVPIVTALLTTYFFTFVVSIVYTYVLPSLNFTAA